MGGKSALFFEKWPILTGLVCNLCGAEQYLKLTHEYDEPHHRWVRWLAKIGSDVDHFAESFGFSTKQTTLLATVPGAIEILTSSSLKHWKLMTSINTDLEQFTLLFSSSRNFQIQGPTLVPVTRFQSMPPYVKAMQPLTRVVQSLE